MKSWLSLGEELVTLSYHIDSVHANASGSFPNSHKLMLCIFEAK